MKIKKYILCIVLGFTFVSCEKEVEQKKSDNEDIKIGEVRTMTFAASVDDGNTKTTLDITNGYMAWESDDFIVVNGQTVTMDKLVSNVAYFKGDVTANTHYIAGYKLDNPTFSYTEGRATSVTYDFPYSQTYSEPSDSKYMKGVIPMVSSSPSTNMDPSDPAKIKLKFYHSCSIVKIPLKGNMVLSKIEVTPDGTAAITGKITATASDKAVTFSAPVRTGVSYENKITLTCNKQLSSSTATDFFIMIPMSAAGTTLKVSFFKSGDDSAPFLTAKLTVPTQTDPNSGKLISMNAANIKDNLLPGVFQVNANGQTVRFSKGNLQYNPNPGTGNSKWRFAANQYDKVPAANNTSCNAETTEWIDMFGYATSGYNDGVAQRYYQPYERTSDNEKYGAGINNIPYNFTGTAYDWGAYNSSSLGSGWRTLSKEEWNYLFAHHIYGVATIKNGTTIIVQGIIVKPLGTTTQTINSKANIDIQLNNWDTYESEGFLFLPSSGYREGTKIIGEPYGATTYYYIASYWSSSPNSTTTNAYKVHYQTSLAGNIGTDITGHKSDGNQVRLVKYVSNTNDYIDEYNINRGLGITINGVTWAPVNCGMLKKGDIINGTPKSNGYPYGKLYQWGRKYGQGRDGDETYPTNDNGGFITGQTNKYDAGGLDNIDKVYKITTNWLSITSKAATDSCNILWNGVNKGKYDPCPVGWRVPTESDFVLLSQSEVTKTVVTNTAPNYITFTKDDQTVVLHSGVRNDGVYSSGTNYYFSYWASEYSTNDTNCAMYFHFNFGTYQTNVYDYRQKAFPVRCVK